MDGITSEVIQEMIVMYEERIRILSSLSVMNSRMDTEKEDTRNKRFMLKEIGNIVSPGFMTRGGIFGEEVQHLEGVLFKLKNA